MAYPSPCCQTEARVYHTVPGQSKSGNFVVVRQRRCQTCGSTFTTWEGQSSPLREPTHRIQREAEGADEDTSASKIAEAIAAGRPMILDPAPCPYCSHDHIAGTYRGSMHNGRFGDNYWRMHKCHSCGKCFHTATDVITGRTIVHKRALTAAEQRELGRAYQPQETEDAD